MPEPPADHTPDDLIVAYLEDTLDESGVAELHAQMRRDPALRRRFVLMTMQTAALCDTLGPPRATPISAAPDADAALGHASPTRSPWVRRSWALLAAAVLLGATTIAIYVNSADTAPSTPSPDAAPVATLIEVTGGGTVLVDNDIAKPGSEYGTGVFAIDDGSAEFMLTNAVKVKLRGATRLVMHSDMEVSLTRGAADFVVPRGARGYTVLLPDGTRIVDLGTRFSVWVDPTGRSFAHVREGLVELHAGDRVSRVGAGETWRIHAGQLTEIGGPTRLAAAADATVSWGVPDRPLGLQDKIYLRTTAQDSGEPRAVYVSLLRFDVDPQVGEIDSARLELTLADDRNAALPSPVEQVLDVFLVPADMAWDEPSITWRSAPGVVRQGGGGLERLGSFTIHADAAPTDTVEFDDARLADALRRRLVDAPPDSSASVSLLLVRVAPVDGEVILALRSRESVGDGGTAPTLTIQTDPRTLPPDE